MCADQRIAVLKFGGSVLKSIDDLGRAAQEIYRWRRDGYQVVAVVSAIGDTTDRLCSQASSFGPDVDLRKTALLLATGELQSAALLGLALDKAGLRSATCDDVVSGLTTSGSWIDARPVDLDRQRLRERLGHFGVVVVPGFIGRDATGQICLLGRGGSDLTALFVASQLQADVCRLIKDVPGLFEFDPKTADFQPRRFSAIRYSDALELDESIVQHKGVRFARDHGLNFHVGAVFSQSGSVVGDFAESTFSQESTLPGRLRVALIGLGTVGLGVYRTLRDQLASHFEVVAIAVRDFDKAIASGADPRLLTDDALAAVHSECHVVVELAGGDELPESWITAALERGKYVVTANKTVLARAGSRLQTLANCRDVSLLYSAAVGGAADILETIRNLTRDGRRITSISGVVNGSANFILDCIYEGETFEQAVERARAAGITEADPGRDLTGIDAAEKLVLMVRHCGYELELEQVVRQRLSASLGQQGAHGQRLRQVASWSVKSHPTAARVIIQTVGPHSLFAQVSGAGNIVQLTTDQGDVVVVRGTGAGRWPTSSAVIADLIDVYLQQCGEQSSIGKHGVPVSVSA